MNAFEAAEKKAEPPIYRKSWKICSAARTRAQEGTSIPATFLRVTISV